MIYGARRLFIARQLNRDVMVEIREMSDREAIVAMDIESRHRADISPYERGLSYARWLRSGQFQSQDDIARALKVSPSQVSRLLKLSRLPSAVLNAFGSPLEICEGWGLDLIDALDDSARRTQTLNRARTLAGKSPRPPALEVYRELLAASAKGRGVKPRTHDDVVTDGSGHPLFRIRHQRHTIALLLPTHQISAVSLEAIRRSVAMILQHANPQTRDAPRKVLAIVPTTPQEVPVQEQTVGL